MNHRLAIFFIIPSLLFAQDLESEKKEHLQRLEALRREIAEVEKLAEAAGQKEAQLSDLLANLEHKISLRKRLLKSLEKDRRLTETDLQSARKRLKRVRSDVATLEDGIDSLRQAISNLWGLVADRAVYIYKNWRWEELRLIFSAQDFNQALVRKKYFNLIAERDKNNLALLKAKKDLLNELMLEKLSLEATLVSTENELKVKIRYKKDLIAETQSEKNKLQSERGKKRNLLEKAKQDHAALLRNLQDKRSAAVEVEKLIAALESRAKTAPDIDLVFPDLDFPKLKGRMEWPTLGKIISRFGRQLNPKLKTWTENTGIDIEAETGADVHTVASGRVTVVTWLRGYGSTLIISHPGGFYTVYTHLDDILVNPGNIVKAGSIIGTVGDSGSLGGAKLHFELWEKREKHDPEKWLKRRG